MKIKINGTNYDIKTSANLTVKEYIELSKLDGNILDYISVVTGLKFKSIADCFFTDLTLNRLHSYVQPIRQVENLDRSYLFMYKRTGQIVSEKTFNFDSVGTMFLMQTRSEQTTNNLELMVYLLAIAIQKEYDAEKIENIYNELLEYNYIQIFSFIAFFFRKLYYGSNKNRTSLSKRIKVFLISLQLKLRRLKPVV